VLAVKRRLARLGWWLLESRSRRQVSQAELFADLWGFFRRFRYAFGIREYYSNPFRIPVENIVLCRILHVVRTRFPNYKPSIRVTNSSLIAKITDPTQKAIVVTIHNGVSTSVIELLQSSGRPCSLITVWSGSGRFYNILGCPADVRMIYPDQDAFLRARRDMQEGRVVFCHPDGLAQGASGAPERLRIGPSIFEFARMVDARIYYALAQVSAAGAIVVQIEEPRCQLGSTSAADMARDFVAFLDSALWSGRKTAYS
jgi:hypothetical protein